MINKNELRIGNMIYDIDNDIIQIKTLRTNDAGIGKVFLINYEDMKGIPITEKILLELGFKLETDEGDIKYYDIQRLWYYVVFDHGDIRLDMKTGKDSISTVFYMDERFQYIHQLQNLFFALTGSELVFSTEP